MAKRQERKPGPGGNWDYVEHGSDQHAALLGLRKAEEGDSPKYKDWTLADATTWGPNATERFLMDMLRSKVNELLSEAPEYQSENPFAPNYAPPIWQPGR